MILNTGENIARRYLYGERLRHEGRTTRGSKAIQEGTNIMSDALAKWHAVGGTNGELLKRLKELEQEPTPEFVPFEEVLKALRAGKTATYHHHPDGTRVQIGVKGSMDWTQRFSWFILTEGNWSIDE